jgi:hypothetical protein
VNKHPPFVIVSYMPSEGAVTIVLGGCRYLYLGILSDLRDAVERLIAKRAYGRAHNILKHAASSAYRIEADGVEVPV